MQITVTIDDELYAKALSLADPTTEPAALIEVCVRAFVQRQSARRLAELGGEMPDLKVPCAAAATRRFPDRLTVDARDFDAVRRLLPPMSHEEFRAWLRRHVIDGIHEDISADMRPAYYVALEVVRNSDQRLDNMLFALRNATEVNTLDRQVLVAHLEKCMDKLGILVPGTPGRDDDAATELWLVENGDALASSNAFLDEHGLPLSGRDAPPTPQSSAD